MDLSSNYHNMTTDELIREADHSGNSLALTLGDRLAAEVEERQEAFEEALQEVIDFHAERIEKEIEEYNAEQLKPDSDNITCYADMIGDNLDEQRVAEAIREMERDGNCVTEETMAYLLEVADDPERLRDLAYDISTAGAAATDVEVSHGYGAVHYCVASIGLGEEEIELSHWLEDLPEVIQRGVAEKLTGEPEGELFYIDNSYEAVNLILNFNWLEEWVSDQKENAAAA